MNFREIIIEDIRGEKVKADFQEVLGNCTVAANGQYDYAQDYVSVQRNQSLYYWVTARPTTPSVFENSYEQVEDEDAPLAD